MTLAAKRQSIGNGLSLKINTTNIDQYEPNDLPLFVKNFNQLSYKKRLRISFRVAEDIKPHFILLRGLLEFNRGPEFQFRYDIVTATIETDIPASAILDLVQLLKNVQDIIEKELRFRTALKSVLEFEAEYRRRKALVYSTIL